MADVFISYSRKDSEFVRRLHDALLAEDKDVWVDWEDIPPVAEWLSEISAAIEGADSLIFVLSPDSVASDVCRQEVDHAVKHNKRLVPIVCREVNAGEVPEALAKLHWIFFNRDDGFEASVGILMEALNTDLDWVRAHTRLLTKSIEWNDKHLDKSLLLRGTDLKDAEGWIARSVGQEPAPTSLQTRYILASQKGHARRQKIIVGSVTTGLVVAVILASVAVYYSVVSEKNRKIALSRQLSAQALQIVQQPDEHVGFYDRALLLAVQAGNVAGTFEARDALLRVLQSNPEAKPFICNTIGSFPNRASDVAFSPDGRWIAIACWDRSIRLWDRASGRQGGSFTGYGDGHVHAVAFSPDSNLIASGHDFGKIMLWDMVTKKTLRRSFSGHAPSAGRLGLGQVRGVAFSPDGAQLASTGEDQTIRLWDVATGQPLGAPMVGHAGPVQDVLFSPHGKRIASLGQDGTVWLWEADRKIPSGRLLPLQDRPAIGVAFSRDGRYVARVIEESAKTMMRVWDIAAWKPADDNALPQMTLDELAGRLVALSRDGGCLARIVGGGVNQGQQAVQLWDVTGNRALGRLSVPGRQAQPTALAFSPEGGHLAIASVSAGNKGKGWLWDVARRMPFCTCLRGHEGGASAGVFGVAFSHDGKRLASAGFDGTVRLWDPQTGDPVDKPIAVIRGRVLAVAFSPDGKWIASGDAASRVLLWDGRTVGSPPVALGKHEAWVNAVAFSPDGRLLASASDDKTVRLWTVAAGKAFGEPLTGHQDQVNAVAFSPDGKLLASASTDGSVRRWNSAAGTPVGEPIHAKRGPVWDLAFSPDGRHLAIAVENPAEKQGEVWFYDVTSGRMLNNPLEGHAYSAKAVAFSPDGRLLASAGGDAAIRLWDVATRKQLGTPLEGGGIFMDVVFSPGGRWLAAANQDATVKLWDMDWQSRACRIANRNLSHEEWQQYLGPEELYRQVCDTIPFRSIDIKNIKMQPPQTRPQNLRNGPSVRGRLMQIRAFQRVFFMVARNKK